MIDVFCDKELKIKIDGNLLIENVQYYAKLKVHDPNLVEKEIKQGQCSQYITWHSRNTIGFIQFRDVVGYVKLFGDTFEVKSSKLLTDLSGNNQFEYLLRDISEYSSTLVFSPAAAGSFDYELNPRVLTANTFYIYRYLSNRLFQETRDSLQNLLDMVILNPHTIQHASPAYTPTFSTRKFSHTTFQRMARGMGNSELVPSNHELYRKPFISKLPNANTGGKILPENLYSVINTISRDTPENRFIKYFLLWCQEIFMNVYKLHSQYHIRDDCQKALRIIRKYLLHPFFKDIGAFSFLPTSSSVLTNRLGYKEIFVHYLKCRNQPKTFKDYFSDLVNRMEIRNISVLFEYWVFFKIAEALFGNNAKLEIIGQHSEMGILKYGLKISDGPKQLFYNKTYKHSHEASYCFRLRPDISLEVCDNGNLRRYFFDAKYSNTTISSSDEDPLVVQKNANVVKMLSYLEAIIGSRFAVIIYPGTKFIFFDKNFSKNDNIVLTPKSMVNFEGVGALPLSPGNIITNEIFRSFMMSFKQHIWGNLDTWMVKP
jgi:uncharacterized protein